MILVSPDGSIINFELLIFIHIDTSKSGRFEILADGVDTSRYTYTVASYDTEYEAQDELRAIVTSYAEGKKIYRLRNDAD